jgi:hypothetical protein
MSCAMSALGLRMIYPSISTTTYPNPSDYWTEAAIRIPRPQDDPPHAGCPCGLLPSRPWRRLGR